MKGLDLCFELRKASRGISRFYDKRLSKTGVRSNQLQMLLALSECSGKNYTALAKELVMTRETLGRDLKTLEQYGLVQLVDLKNKRDGKSCILTESAHLYINRCKLLAEKADQEMMAEFEVTHRDQLLNNLREIIDVVSVLNSRNGKANE